MRVRFNHLTLLLLIPLVVSCSPPTAPGCYERLADGRYLYHPDHTPVRGWCPTVLELRVLGLFPPLR